ncbi:hypothetical protein CEXT_508361 [Caerostris extrusa]|uniref:Uncharacterized protein n=1 Tax=Caerostris extrusa TaxID=172846 RepID=A0AAV4TWG2_CAEEX|nr:hypothetical protein CEXT_508361 [Caerostris extrusa]
MMKSINTENMLLDMRYGFDTELQMNILPHNTTSISNKHSQRKFITSSAPPQHEKKGFWFTDHPRYRHEDFRFCSSSQIWITLP